MQDVTGAAELRQAFDKCDVDGNDRIASKEFLALLRALDSDLSVDECLLAFDLADSDGDGFISFDEFASWWTGD